LGRRATFDFGLLVALMSQLLQALEFAHDRGVVHRDVKPSNLIVTGQGLLKVADFGVARIDTSNLTGAGVVVGTPSYMSPEQCMGEAVDARSDLSASASCSMNSSPARSRSAVRSRASRTRSAARTRCRLRRLHPLHCPMRSTACWPRRSPSSPVSAFRARERSTTRWARWRARRSRTAAARPS
ncbi:MAG: protein kinase, partial [Betaproteobacteria bacterium]|nr:protein kinase [Betaproteobacteria bacterium]